MPGEEADFVCRTPDEVITALQTMVVRGAQMCIRDRVMPLYQSSNGFGMKAGNFDMDFSGGLGGVALGADYTFDNAIRAGITTFYILAVYFGSVSIRNTRHAVACGLLADLAGVIAAIAIAYLFF